MKMMSPISPVLVVMAASLLMSMSSADETECRHTFSSADGTEGTFTSPGYPAHYPANVDCRYTFLATEGERIQITVNDLDLAYDDGDPQDPYDCWEVDALYVSNDLEDPTKDENVIGKYCASCLPPAVMSGSIDMTVAFITLGHSNGQDTRGFNATYKFVTDLGISTNGIQTGDFECGFVFLGGDTPQGTFSSPNFPGLYPRDTECQYLFFGAPKQVVLIKFFDVDVDGIYPGCNGGTLSDYIEVSNSQYYAGVEDRLDERYCGVWNGQDSAISEGRVFRVTFLSNGLYDGTGFNATYEFVQLD